MGFVSAIGGFWTVVILCILCSTVVKIMQLRVTRDDNRDSNPDDVEAMQQMHRSLKRMEDRIESLETILIDRATHKSRVRQDWE